MSKPYKVLDLFAGIGGFSLGLERTGDFETVAFCEIDAKCRRVLHKHWADVPMYEDIKELTIERLQADGIVPDVIVGGFPCQDISQAGRGKGIVGERSGLWGEMLRLIRDVRPTWAIVENVSALRSKGLAMVLQDLCEIGYCVEWHCIPASAVGAPHQRDHIWIVAHPNPHSCTAGEPRRASGEVPATSEGLRGGASEGETRKEPRSGCQDVADTRCLAAQVSAEGRFPAVQVVERNSWWEVEPDVGRVVDGVSTKLDGRLNSRMDRLKQLGNSVVPQVVELLGRAIVLSDKNKQGVMV